MRGLEGVAWPFELRRTGTFVDGLEVKRQEEFRQLAPSSPTDQDFPDLGFLKRDVSVESQHLICVGYQAPSNCKTLAWLRAWESQHS